MCLVCISSQRHILSQRLFVDRPLACLFMQRTIWEVLKVALKGSAKYIGKKILLQVLKSYFTFFHCLVPRIVPYGLEVFI